MAGLRGVLALLFPSLLLLSPGCACGGGAGAADAGPDAPPLPDAGLDAAAPDGGERDAGPDAPSDAGPVTFALAVVAPPDGLPFGVPLGMSERAEVVGYAGPEAWSPISRALRVAPGASSSTALPTPEREMAWAYDVDEAGATVVGTYHMRPYAWVEGAGHFVSVPDGWFSGSVHAIGPGGLLAGSFADSDDALPPNPVGPRPCAWAEWAAAPTLLAPYEVGLPLGAAWAISAAGAIAGSVETSGGFRACRWDDATSLPTLVGELPGVELGEGRAIDTHGHVAGRVTIAGTSHGFVELDGAPALLPPLVTGAYTEALGMNDAHWIVGTTSMGDGTVHAVLWIDGAAIDLNDRVTLPAGVRHLSAAVAVTNEGVIAAEAVMDGSTTDELRSVAILRPAR